MSDKFDETKYKKEWNKKNLSVVKASYKKEFVEEFKSSCEALDIKQSDAIRKAMLETIAQAKKERNNMKEQKAQKVLDELKGRLSNITDDVSVNYIIDFKNGNCIGLEEIQEWYQLYNELDEQLKSFVDENDYDDVVDFDKITEDAAIKEMKENGYLESDQACMINFEDFCFIFADKLSKQ